MLDKDLDKEIGKEEQFLSGVSQYAKNITLNTTIDAEKKAAWDRWYSIAFPAREKLSVQIDEYSSIITPALAELKSKLAELRVRLDKEHS